MDNQETNIANVSPVEKQALSDTILAFIPKNTAGYTTKNQIIDIQIPKTEHVLRLNEAYLQVELLTNFKANINYAATAGEEQYVGLINSATIFDQVYIKNNGKTIHTDTFSQINSRIWQMSKSTNYQIANPASFLNYDDVSANDGLLVFKLTAGAAAFNAGVEVPLRFRLKIPLPSVYQCFDNCDNFSTTQLNDDITLSMQLSHPNKYMCLITADSTTHKVKRIEPFGINSSIYTDEIIPHIKANVAGYDATTDVVQFAASFALGTDNSNQAEWKPYTYAGAGTAGTDYVGTITAYTIQTLDDDSKYYIESLKMVVPGHYPTADETANYANLVANGAVHYSFRDCDIKSQATDFTNGTQHLNFSTNTENIFAVMMLASHAYSYTVFDKPYVDKLECNLSEIYKLANDKVHTEGTYDRDNDMYKNLLDGFGVESFKNLQRFDKQITKDFLQKTPAVKSWNADNTVMDRTSLQTGNYIQWYKVAPGNQMGISANYFANIINYKFESKTDSSHNYACNYSNSNIFCAQLRYRMLIYKEGGIDIICPFAEELNARNIASNAPNSDAHGLPALIPLLAKPATDLLGGAVRGIKGLIYKNRLHDNSTYAYSKLGKDGFEKHRGILESNATMRRRKFKKFIDNLAESEKQLANVDTHGLLIRHGEEGSLGEGAGAASNPSTVPRSSLDDFEHERPVDLNMLNLTNLYKRSNREILVDVEFRMYLVLDYKYGFNKNKLRLQSFGDESATEYCAHGFRDWIRDKWRRLVGFFKGRGKEIAKEAGKQIITNAAEIVKQYANEILMGKLNIKDVPSKFKKQVLAMIKDNQLTGTPVDNITSKALEYYKKIKDGTMNWSQVPGDMKDIINKLQAQQTAQNGLLVRHGFVGTINVHPTVDYHVMKRRMNKIMAMNPMLMRQKDLRRLYRFKHFQEHPIVDTTHGRLGDLVGKLFNLARPMITPIIHKYTDPYKPYIEPLKPLVHKIPGMEKYIDKWHNLKTKIMGSDNHGLKEMLAKMKQLPGYRSWTPMDKYKYMKPISKPIFAGDYKTWIEHEQNLGKPKKPRINDEYANKWKLIKQDVIKGNNHGLKELLIQMKANPKYKNWNARKRYRMLKYATMSAPADEK